MAKPWHNMPPNFPTDGLECWVRRYNLWTSFDATWDLGTWSFVLANGASMPWWMVGSWKPKP